MNRFSEGLYLQKSQSITMTSSSSANAESTEQEVNCTGNEVITEEEQQEADKISSIIREITGAEEKLNYSSISDNIDNDEIYAYKVQFL